MSEESLISLSDHPTGVSEDSGDDDDRVKVGTADPGLLFSILIVLGVLFGITSVFMFRLEETGAGLFMAISLAPIFFLAYMVGGRLTASVDPEKKKLIVEKRVMFAPQEDTYATVDVEVRWITDPTRSNSKPVVQLRVQDQVIVLSKVLVSNEKLASFGITVKESARGARLRQAHSYGDV